MQSLFSTALSGLNAAGAVVGTAASNLANLDSAGYKARRATLESARGGGVRVASVTADPTPGAVDGEGRELSNVDLATEAVELRRGAQLYGANAMVVRVGDEMMGTLLDIFDRRPRR